MQWNKLQSFQLSAFDLWVHHCGLQSSGLLYPWLDL